MPSVEVLDRIRGNITAIPDIENVPAPVEFILTKLDEIVEMTPEEQSPQVEAFSNTVSLWQAFTSMLEAEELQKKAQKDEERVATAKAHQAAKEAFDEIQRIRTNNIWDQRYLEADVFFTNLAAALNISYGGMKLGIESIRNTAATLAGIQEAYFPKTEAQAA